MNNGSRERRKYERVTLPKPWPARLDNGRAYLTELSINDARILHQGRIPEGETRSLQFEWEGYPLTFRCQIEKSDIERLSNESPSKTIYRSEVVLLNLGTSASGSQLREMVADHVRRALDEQKANARGIPALAANSYQTGSAEKGYLTFRFVRGEWVRSETNDPKQPIDGFTIAATEDPEQIELLCTSYVDADHEGRKMIRKMAELSVSALEGIPTRRYKP
ncbi:MAG: hypothetical protein WBX15_01170 [Thermoanaerobaculia bacterium]